MIINISKDYFNTLEDMTKLAHLGGVLKRESWYFTNKKKNSNRFYGQGNFCKNVIV